MGWTKAKTAVVLGVVALLVVGTATTYINVTRDASPPELVEAPPPEPQYQGMTLREWIAANAATPGLNVIWSEDIMSYRRTALKAMGEPAATYLHWMVAHPRQALQGLNDATDRPSQGLPRRQQKLHKHLQDSATFENMLNVVVALRLIGPDARATAHDLVRLWESNGTPMYAQYNGFPLALAALGDVTPETLAALHRHFKSPDRLHRSLCAFAAWRLNPTDEQAVAVLRRELAATDSEVHPRYTLLHVFWQFGTNATPFLTEIRNLIATSPITRSEYQTIAARAAWHILNTSGLATEVIQRLGTAASRPGAAVDDVQRFALTALYLAEVPGVRELSVPILRKLTDYSEASAATFAENILDRLEVPANGQTSPPP
jgi:hypothetical protein